ncbi:MAG: molybdate ABC transporter substrate-binding protein [Gammaproteobacteria bacterium]|nr:molybdate ABC transporter substrate-binding protein [Gammaproteobacteria bacterium]
MQAVYGLYTLNLSQLLRLLVWIVSVYLACVSGAIKQVAADDRNRAIKIATASNFLLPLKYIKLKFEKEYAIKLKITAGSTAKLYAQIMNGAPYDIFLAADKLTPQKLVGDGIARFEDEFQYVQGQLVLWTVNSKYKNNEDLKQRLISLDFRRLALANPKTAPYGRAAMEVLGYFDLHVPRSRLILGESVGQAYQFTSSGNVDMGFVAYSQVKTDLLEGSYWVLPAEAYQPIYQYGILLAYDRQKDEQKINAGQFVKYLQSQDVQKILRQRFGYL